MLRRSAVVVEHRQPLQQLMRRELIVAERVIYVRRMVTLLVKILSHLCVQQQCA